MLRPTLDASAGLALSAALASVTRARGRRETRAQRTVVEAVSRLFLNVEDPYARDDIDPADLAAQLSSPESREFAAQMLVLVALVDSRPAHVCRDSVVAYCDALNEVPENLSVLHDVVHRHIRRAHLHLYRRFLIDGLRTGSLSGDVAAVREWFPDGRNHPEIAAPYLALEHLPEDSFGNQFFQFRINRGFNLPGQKGALPTLYGFELHDSIHVLSGYNLTATDEINVVAFHAGASSRLPWLLIAVNLITFNTGLPYGPVRLLNYSPEEGMLDPEGFIHALDRGLHVRQDLSRDFDLQAHWHLPLEEVRNRLGIVGAGDVRIPRDTT